MSGPFVFIGTHRISDGQLEALKKDARVLVQLVEEREPQLLAFNFFLNNALTYREQRLKGARALFGGWVSFCLVCSVGAAANVGVAAFLHDAQHGDWRFAAMAGILVAAVWNYALCSLVNRCRYYSQPENNIQVVKK